MLTMWRYVQTAAWPQPEPQPEPQPDPQPDRSSLYVNNVDVTLTAAVRTAAVCLGHYPEYPKRIIPMLTSPFKDRVSIIS